MCIRNYLTLLFVILGCIFTFTNSEYRMEGGSDEYIERSLYVVLIRYMGVNKCVGSLVTLQKVVTAADCVVDRHKHLFRVAAGVTNLHDKWENGQVLRVKDVVHPPGYNSDMKHMNIAVMTLDGLINGDSRVETINICTHWCKLMRVRQFGWENAENDQISNPIQFTNWLSIEHSDCEKHYRSPNIPLTRAMICAVPATYGGCLVDPGTPGVVMGKLCAVASHYLNHADRNSVVVFTSVTNNKVFKFLNKALRS